MQKMCSGDLRAQRAEDFKAVANTDTSNSIRPLKVSSVFRQLRLASGLGSVLLLNSGSSLARRGSECGVLDRQEFLSETHLCLTSHRKVGARLQPRKEPGLRGPILILEAVKSHRRVLSKKGWPERELSGVLETSCVLVKRCMCVYTRSCICV